MPEEQGDIVPVSSSELSPSSGTNSDPNTILLKAGMTTIASLAAFEQYRENQDKDSLVEISLALARLRIELEQELRKIAYHNNIDINNRPLGLVSLARELASKEILPSLWVKAIEEIVSVCDRVIHGTKISDNTAASVIRVGSQMLEELRLVSAIN
jgi:hypothetical protein